MAPDQTDELCLENIDEFVHDENKIVTCKWLSLTLKIHINQAKRLLYSFLQQQRIKKDKDVNATYFVAGLTKGSNGVLEHTCVVVPEEDLESTRKQLAVVTSCHVYSVQRAQLKDSNALYMTDYDGVKENLSECTKYSSIHCQRAAVPRKVSRVSNAASEKQNTEAAVDKKLNGSSGDSVQNGSATSIPKSKKAEPKGSIASMFAQTAKKSDADNSNANVDASSAPSKKEEKKGGKAAAKKGGVMDFFANAKPPAKNMAQQKPSEQPKVQQKEKTAPADSRSQADKTKETKSKKKGRPKDDSDDDDGPQKKRRRRIKNDLFDSSSEEARRRKRKLVPKTYLDEDGFMVTEKVWESESTDASEVEEDSKKKATPEKQKATSGKQKAPSPAKKTSPQKKGSPAKGKQTSLTSFFKKK
ncbi:hypothetical protein BaRGS_00022277 [Batillaria attramentaria]|uniref:DNA polymerase delta subunit 3 n=1 Tax=Batillaria attramentaria TaxID=370345 RepID=A0ABD0KH38_9CAEN